MRKLARLFAWAGGAIFVASLATCAYAYLITWGRTIFWTTTSSFTALAIDVLLVTVFAAHHSIFARDPVKTALARAIPAPQLRSVYVWIASLLLIAVCWWWQPVGGEFYRITGAGALLFTAAQLAGLALIAGAVRDLDPLELAGIHQPSANAGSLQAHGPYGLVRHPLYLGWVLIVFGAAHLTGDRLAFAVITTTYLVIAVPWEERALRKEFGENYTRYARAVRWRIVPFIY
jgi:hypothetical protein